MKRNVQPGDMITIGPHGVERLVVDVDPLQPAAQTASTFVTVAISRDQFGAAVVSNPQTTARWINIDLDNIHLVGTAKFKMEIKYTITKAKDV